MINRKVQLGVGLLAALAMSVTVLGYAYTWTGNGADDEWCTNNNWTRSGCGSPCNECPDDSSDDATVAADLETSFDELEIDDWVIQDSDVTLSFYNGYECCPCGGFTNYGLFDSIEISASNGQTASLTVTAAECGMFGTQ